MRIENVEVYPVSTRRVVAGNVYGSSLFYILRIRTDEGLTGIGEASDILHHEPPDVEYLVERVRRDLAGRDPFNMNELQGVVRGFAFSEWRAGLDIALYDLLAKALRLPLYTLLGGKTRDRVVIAFPVWTMTRKEEVPKKLAEIDAMVERGVKAIRVYVGANVEADKELIKGIWDRWGSELLIRSLDTSNRFTPKNAIRFIREVERYEFQYLESPCASIEGMAEVRRAVDTPISQHVGSLEHALQMIRGRAVDIFNVALAAGGFHWARKVFTLAEAAGIECVVGTTQELNIGTAAQAHLIASTPNIHYACDPAGPLFYERDVTKTGVTFREGEMLIPEGYGLGLEIDEDKLRELTLKPGEQKRLL
ncbi:MAG: mandelate racemase/muconate lactonizing enzyme family protein [Candidatus Bathyarchaeia archaeon]